MNREFIEFEGEFWRLGRIWKDDVNMDFQNMKVKVVKTWSYMEG